MATELARTLPPKELIEKGICPIKKEYIVNESNSHVRKEVEVVGSVVAKQQPERKKSGTQLKKERKQAKQAQMCFHYIKDTCTFGDECRYSHDLSDYVKAKPADLPGECPFSSLEKCPFSLTCRWATKHKNPDEHTKKWLLSKLPGSFGAPEGSNEEQATENMAAGDESATASHLNGSEEQQAAPAPAGEPATVPENQEPAGADTPADATHPMVEHKGMQMYVLPVASEIKPVKNQMTAVIGHDLRKHTYDYSRADEVLKSLGVSNNLKLKDRKTKDEKKKAQQVETVEVWCPGNQEKAIEESEAADEAAADTPAVKKQKVDSGEGTIPIYDISKSSNTEGGIVNQRDGARRVDFAGKLYCAPLTTTGNLPFRRIVKQFGCDITCGEMALTSNLLQGQQSEWALLKRHPCEDIFGVQVCGAHPDSVARCIQLLDDNLDLDFIDLNMGCPIDLICYKGMGSALLQRPKRFAQVVKAAAQTAKNCCVTFKTRTGYYDKQRTAAAILKEAGGWGAAAVTVHGRTRAQRYSKLADWSYVEHCAAMAAPGNVQVIGNGDVFSFEDYEAHMKSGNLASCMIARGALIKPWLFTEIKERRHWDISAGERLDMLKEYCKHGLEHWGSDEKGVENTRRFLLEWLSFLCRYVPVGLLEVVPQHMTWRPPAFKGRSDLETLLSSNSAQDWVRITEMLLGPAPDGFTFSPKHRSNAYETVKGGEHEEVQG